MASVRGSSAGPAGSSCNRRARTATPGRRTHEIEAPGEKAARRVARRAGSLSRRRRRTSDRSDPRAHEHGRDDGTRRSPHLSRPVASSPPTSGSSNPSSSSRCRRDTSRNRTPSTSRPERRLDRRAEPGTDVVRVAQIDVARLSRPRRCRIHLGDEVRRPSNVDPSRGRRGRGCRLESTPGIVATRGATRGPAWSWLNRRREHARPAHRRRAPRRLLVQRQRRCRSGSLGTSRMRGPRR